MVLPSIPNFPQIPCCTLQTVPANPEGQVAVLETGREKEAELRLLAERLGPRLVVPEVWRELLPHAGLLISSAISGGTMKQRFEEAVRAAPRRCWLLIEPLRMEFLLPCPTGIGKEVAVINYDQCFYSDSLCCQYTHFIRNNCGTMQLWDTEETIEKKKEQAKEAGFLGYAEILLP